MAVPLVSVVIPCYNQGRFLADAVESALRQIHPAVEIIVVDDGSGDETADVAASFPGVTYIRQRNQGTAIARNTGLHESRGEYIIFLDADDRLLPEAIVEGLRFLSAHPECAFVTGHVRLIAPDGSPAGIPPQEHAETNQYIALLRSNYIWTPGVVMYRRSVFESVALFDPSAGGSADYELNIRIARHFPIGCHHRVILEYRRHGANMSGNAAHMLRSAISVRRSQRKYVERDQSARDAWKSGMRIVQEDFGGRLIEEVKVNLRTRGRRARGIQGLWCLLRYYPAGLLEQIVARYSGHANRRMGSRIDP